MKNKTYISILLVALLLFFGCAKDFPGEIVLKKAGKGKGACFGVIDGITITKDSIAVFQFPDGNAKYRTKMGKGGIFLLNKKPGEYKLLSYTFVNESGTIEVILQKPLHFEIEGGKVKYIGRIFTSPISNDVYLIDEFVRDSSIFTHHFGSKTPFVSNFPNEKYYGLMRAAKGPLKSDSQRASAAMIKFSFTVFLLGDVRPGFEVLLDDIPNISEIPPHQVEIDGFSIDRDPVTNSQLSAFAKEARINLPSGCNKGASRFYGNSVKPGWENKPATCVSWEMAMAYCAGRNGSLPTEAQWELATRGKPWGNRKYGGIKRGVIPGESSGNRAIGSANWWVSPWGMTVDGKVIAEWVYDRYSQRYYQEGPSKNPRGPKTGSNHVVRAGPYRFELDGKYRSVKIGFRCVKSDLVPPFTSSTLEPDPDTARGTSYNTDGLSRLVVKKRSRIYFKPTIASQVILEVKSGVVVINLGREAGWWHVRMEDGREGYLFEDFARPLK